MSKYFIVHDFMINEMKLAGAELLVYALIHSYSRDGEGIYIGRLEDISNRTGVSRRSVVSVLERLVCRDLLIKKEYRKGRSPATSYRVNTVTGAHGAEIAPSTVQKVYVHGAEIAPSTYSNKIYKKKDNTNVLSKKEGEMAKRTIASTESIKKGKRATRISPDWRVTEELAKYANEKGVDESTLLIEEEKFKNYWESEGRASARKIDWDKTFRNWILNVVGRMTVGQKNNSQKNNYKDCSNVTNSNLEVLARMKGVKTSLF